ncbi:hypothetical protein HDU76_007859 [Blyttiomyces sp. JEL0837]|nr:hypothetical protein HDU76_007859 [Blyttiomyces sp. JEL0837]
MEQALNPKSRVRRQSSVSAVTSDIISPSNATPTHRDLTDGAGTDRFQETDPENEYLQHRSFWSRIVDISFSVLFFMAHGNNANIVLEYAALIVEDLQLMTFFLTSEIGMPYFLPEGLREVSDRDYGASNIERSFQIIFAMCSTSVLLMVANVAFIAYGVLTIAYMANNNIAVHGDSSPKCSTTAIQRKVHGRLELNYLVLKTVLIVVFKFWDESFYLAKVFSALAVCVILTFLALFYLPYYNPALNSLRIGLFSAATSVGVVSVTSSVIYAITGAERGIETFICMIILPFVGFAVGTIGTAKLLKYIQTNTVARLTEQEKRINDSEEYLVFLFWPHVEIAARLITAHMNERKRKFDRNLIPLVKKIFKRGAKEFQHQPFVLVSSAWYTHHLNFDVPQLSSATSPTAIIKRMSPPLDVQFQLYYNNQISSHSREANFHELNVRLDVAKFAEFQKQDHDAKLHHVLAIQELRNMWKLIQDKNYDLQELAKITGKLSMHAQKSQAAYSQLLAKFPKSKILLRYFSRFCFDVTKDIIRGESLKAYANELEEMEAVTHVPNMDLDISASMPENLNSAAIQERSVSPSLLDESEKAPSKDGRGSQGSGSAIIQIEVATSRDVIAARQAGMNHSLSDILKRERRASVPAYQPRASIIKVGNTESQASSQTSSTSAARRQQLYTQKRREGQLDSRALTVKAMFLLKTVTLIALVIANFVVVTTLLEEYSKAIDLLDSHGDRGFYIPLELRRVRQLQKAKSTIEFENLKSNLRFEMAALKDAEQNLLQAGDYQSADPSFENGISVQSRHYPASKEITAENTSLYGFTHRLIYIGDSIANDTEMDLNDLYNNDIYFVLDNFDKSKELADTAAESFLSKNWTESQSTSLRIYILTAILVLVKVGFVILVDGVFVQFRRRLQNTLEIFRHVPKDVIQESVSQLEEADSLDIFPPYIIKHAENYKEGKLVWSLASFRIFLGITAVIMTSLAVSFAYVNLLGIQTIGENLVVTDQGNKMSELGIRAFNTANELYLKGTMDPMLPLMDYSTLRGIYHDEALKLQSILNKVIFGDPTRNPAAPSASSYPDDAQYILNTEPCLPLNKSICAFPRQWNTTINYNHDKISHGLLQLSKIISDIHISLSTTTSNGSIPDEKHISLLDALLEPDYLDGWREFVTVIQKDSTNVSDGRKTISIVIATLQLLLVSAGFVVQLIIVSQILASFK